MKIQIIGASGVGKTTIGKYISKIHNIKFIDTDNYYWKDIKKNITNSIEEKNKLFNRDIKDISDYIISGSNYSWNFKPLDNIDLLVFILIESDEIRLNRLRERELTNNPKTSFWKDEQGLWTNDFIEWSKRYFIELDNTKGGFYQIHQKEYNESLSKKIIIDGCLDLNEIYKIIIKEINK